MSEQSNKAAIELWNRYREVCLAYGIHCRTWDQLDDEPGSHEQTAWKEFAADLMPMDRLDALLKVVGSPAKCKSCDADVLWVTTKTGKKTPYDLDGTNHFATCPNALLHRKAGKPRVEHRD